MDYCTTCLLAPTSGETKADDQMNGIGGEKNYFCNFLLAVSPSPVYKHRLREHVRRVIFIKSLFFLPVRSLGEKSEALR